MTKALIILNLTGLLFLGNACSMNSSSYQTPLKVGEKKIFVEVATTSEQMAKGLSGRAALTDAQGMLFVFNPPQRPGFWMKEMKFGLDIIWVKDQKIIGITPNIPTPMSGQELKLWKNLPTYSPPADIDLVLEVNAGWSEKHKIKVGDKVLFEN